MISSRRIGIVIAAVMTIALIVSAALVVAGNYYSEKGALSYEPLYVVEVFETEIISIEILAEEQDWENMLENATQEEYIMADVIINGTKFQDVGIRPKGNSSLTQVASSDSDRYSFRLQFDEYVSGQTCFGLTGFVVNNMLGDNSYMKEFVSYDLMKQAGVDTPCYGFANIKVNGQNWGLYLAVELYNESYEQRAFNTGKGMLYNVKMSGGKGNQKDENDMPAMDGLRQRDEMPQTADERLAQANTAPRSTDNAGQNQQGDTAAGQMLSGADQQSARDADTVQFAEGQSNRGGRGQMGGGIGGANTGGSLAYIDDDPDSYSSIFENVVGKGTDADYARVISALKALSEGRDLETYFDVDQILRYLAAHTVVVNLDSYSSSMAQNYYIYELDGQVTILPWDYNLSWGGFQSGNALSVINFPIDTPVSGVEISSRPLLEKLFANAEYLDRYHAYLQDLVDTYFANGKFEATIRALDERIGEYVENDATAFCTYAQYRTAVETFITLGDLRAQSIQGQLNGTVPATAQGQSDNPDQLIAAEEINLSDLGSMGGGRGGQNTEAGQGYGNMQGAQGGQSWFGGIGNDMDSELMWQAMQILQQANGELTDEVKAQLTQLGLTNEQLEQVSVISHGLLDSMNGLGGPLRMNGDQEPANMQDAQKTVGTEVSQTAPKGGYFALMGGLVLLLIGATIFLSFHKRNF